ncbi:MAG: hypothetical protein KBC43_07990 [Bacteroidales bacterium]|nr:hypothetical protein [Bacteroidales bacterium]
MKTKSFCFIVLVILFTGLFITLISCKKDSEEPEYYRLTERSYNSHDSLKLMAWYTYSGEKIESIKYLLLEGKDSIRCLPEYPDENNIILEYSVYFAGIWYPFQKEAMEFANDQMVLYTYYFLDGAYWTPSERIEFVYSGTNLIEEVKWEYKFSSWSPYLKISYLYNEDQLVESDYYTYQNDWTLSAKDVAVLFDGRIDQVITYNCLSGDCTDDYLLKIFYNSDRVSRIEEYYKFGSTWDTTGLYQFRYDAHKNLTSERFTGGGEDNSIEYKYEAGPGNFLQIKIPGGGLINTGNYPVPSCTYRNVTSLQTLRPFQPLARFHQ